VQRFACERKHNGNIGEEVNGIFECDFREGDGKKALVLAIH
jgi:hypothetical protein